MQKLIPLILILLSNCALKIPNTHEPTPIEWDAYTRANMLWKEYMPFIGYNCEVKIYRSTYFAHYPTVEEVHEACNGDPCISPNIVGCHITDRYGPEWDLQSRTVIIYWEGHPNFEWLMVHEYSHFASKCVYGDSDPDHSNPYVWDWFVAANGMPEGEPPPDEYGLQ